MAHFSKEQKAKVVAGLKEIMPAGWKYSVAVRHHSEVVLTVQQAPVELVKIAQSKGYSAVCGVQVNTHHMHSHFKGTEVEELFVKIQKVLYGADYYDRSDIMVDHHDTAYYVSMNIGKWDKPFVCVA
jgi:hypothetical protein